MVPESQMDFYETLRTEVVKQAVKDLQKAMRKSARVGYECDEQIKLEAWFRSKWGQLLCGDNGEYMIAKCRETYKTSGHPNGKIQLSDKVQKQICADWKKGTKVAVILKKYGIKIGRFNSILRRWDV